MIHCTQLPQQMVYLKHDGTDGTVTQTGQLSNGQTGQPIQASISKL